LSKLCDRLARVRKASGTIGFAAGRADAPRMLVVPVLDDVPATDVAAPVRQRADAIVLQHDPEDGESALRAMQKAFRDVPVGLRLAGPDFDERVLTGECDFVLCGVDAPSSLLALSSTGIFMEIDAGVEASRLRAMADFGVEGFVLASESLNLHSLSAAVECRRARGMTGCPVLVKVLEPLSPVQVTALWKAGVDGLMTDAGGGMDLVVATRNAVDQAKLESTPLKSGLSVSIGTQLGSASETQEETVEDDDYDDE